MKICPNCGHDNPEGVNFCENCGTDLRSETAGQTDSDQQKTCPRCQALNPQDSRFCENCGYDFEAPDPKQPDTEAAESSAPTPAKPAAKTPASEPQVAPVEPVAPKKVATRPQAPDNQVTSQPAPKENKSKRQWVISAVILILLICGGGYLLYSNGSHAAKPARSEKKASSQAQRRQSSSSQATSHQATVNFNQTEIKDAVTAALDPLQGTSSAYVSPVDSSQSVVVNNGSQSAASSIKVFILVTAYAMAKEGVFDLDATHTVTDSEKVGGTGVIQDMDAGTKLTYREVLQHMIDDSDNTGANIMIAKMGGFSLINNKIKSMGATDTKLQRKMMDTDAIEDGRDNTTSARDLGMTLKKIYNHQLVSKTADDDMLEILANNRNRAKLPKLLPSEAKVYNKTGEYADYGVQNDAEIVANKRGAFVAVVLAQDGKEADQVSAMNQLGLKLYQNILE
ncbi:MULTISPECIES: serine hydrolase [Levilactobacillus]|uniref:Beta-lactamase n=1 Tax=Levilactobacillus paucivorans TaxID=616990 RepID=A0A0R2LWJ6_9LACO|nr:MULTISPECIES: serine hydrolase [Levilactobacillus]KRO05511.1 beta-lactamase [Levilactobacillus paucivorans]